MRRRFHRGPPCNIWTKDENTTAPVLCPTLSHSLASSLKWGARPSASLAWGQHQSCPVQTGGEAVKMPERSSVLCPTHLENPCQRIGQTCRGWVLSGVRWAQCSTYPLAWRTWQSFDDGKRLPTRGLHTVLSLLLKLAYVVHLESKLSPAIL